MNSGAIPFPVTIIHGILVIYQALGILVIQICLTEIIPLNGAIIYFFELMFADSWRVLVSVSCRTQ